MGLALSRFHELKKRDYYCAARGRDVFEDTQSFRWLLQGEQVCTKWNGRAGDGWVWQAEGTRDGRHRLGGTARRLKPGAGGQNKERLRWTDPEDQSIDPTGWERAH